MDPLRSTPTHAGRARDAALRRASALTKWIAVGAIALVGALAGFVAQAKPGRSSGTSQASGAGAGGGSRSSRPVSSGTATGSPAPSPSPSTLAPPPAAPAPAPAPSSPGVVSGGS